GDLACADRVVVQAHGLLAGPVQVQELGDDPAGHLRAHAALAQPDAEVDLLGPEVLGPHVPVHLIEVVVPAGTAVGGGIQAGGPHVGRVGPVRDAQVHLGVG